MSCLNKNILNIDCVPDSLQSDVHVLSYLIFLIPALGSHHYYNHCTFGERTLKEESNLPMVM